MTMTNEARIKLLKELEEAKAERLGPWVLELNLAEVQILLEGLECIRGEAATGEIRTGAEELIERLCKLFRQN